LRTISLPAPKISHDEESTVTLEVEGSLVVVGANGSGKTRLGSWIETNDSNSDQVHDVHRISAQKSLSMPASATSIDVEYALQSLIHGVPNQNIQRTQINSGTRYFYRWGQNPVTSLLNDFQQLLTYLFSEFNDTNASYVQEVSRVPDKRIPPPETKLGATQRIWQEVLPHRKLRIGGGRVETLIPSLTGFGATEHKYNASEMSDGERVIFYLIGQALSAPENGTIIVDEPELHLHRSIQTRLWDAIETERSDCLFVYLTHDLDFAASRISSTTIWLESYDGSEWNWQNVE
jgi:ABC-type cobalamin/Fe3+-siderophores transport system ATPase subunit